MAGAVGAVSRAGAGTGVGVPGLMYRASLPPGIFLAGSSLPGGGIVSPLGEVMTPEPQPQLSQPQSWRWNKLLQKLLQRDQKPQPLSQPQLLEEPHPPSQPVQPRGAQLGWQQVGAGAQHVGREQVGAHPQPQSS